MSVSPTSSFLLTDKLALVTGSGRGMGKTIALELASRGASVVINYSRSSSAGAANDVVEHIKSTYGPAVDAVAVQADVSNPAEIEMLFHKGSAHFSRDGHKRLFDIVVSNSGVESFQHGGDITAAEIDRVFTVNTRGQLLVASQAYHWIDPVRGGRIVMQSSVSAQAKGVHNHAVYSGSKAAIQAFARCLAVDYGSHNITVNAMAPGGIKTDMYVEAARKYVPDDGKYTDEEIDRMMSKMSPLNRIGQPPDVARVVAFVCSEDGGWINGQVLEVSGGVMI